MRNKNFTKISVPILLQKFGEVKDLGYYGLLIKIVLAIDKMPPDLVALGTLVVHSRGGNRNLVFRLPRKGAIR